MTVPTHAEAKTIISSEREAGIVSAFTAAWNDWENCPDRGNYSRWARTRANMIFERLAARLQEAFTNDPGVRFHFKSETIKIVFDNSIVARVKKANSDGLGENIVTGAVTQFVQAQPDLDGLGGLKKIEIVYVLNKFQTSIRDIVAQARDGGMQIWRWTLGKGAEGAEIIPFALPPAPQPRGGVAADEVVNPKPIKKPDEASESN
jgi:hypothetical protein